MSIGPLTTRGKCAMPDCEIALFPSEKTPVYYVCKHTLVNGSEYFKNMFYGVGEFEERKNNEVYFQDLKTVELRAFLFWVTRQPFKPLSSDANDLCALINLADRFMCPKLEQQLVDHLSTDDFKLTVTSAVSRFKLLEVADKHKGKDGCILEACVQLCAVEDIDKLSALINKISDRTLAAVYSLAGKIATERYRNLSRTVSTKKPEQFTKKIRIDRRFLCEKSK